MAKIYERLLSTNIIRKKKSGTRLRFNVKILLGEDSICMVNLLEIPRVKFFFLIT